VGMPLPEWTPFRGGLPDPTEPGVFQAQMARQWASPARSESAVGLHLAPSPD
jgi:hypothetical protein